MRTTLDLEKPILEGLKDLQKKENRSLSQLASSLLAEALCRREQLAQSSDAPLEWSISDMGAKVDLSDKDALYRALDES